MYMHMCACAGFCACVCVFLFVFVPALVFACAFLSKYLYMRLTLLFVLVS